MRRAPVILALLALASSAVAQPGRAPHLVGPPPVQHAVPSFPARGPETAVTSPRVTPTDPIAARYSPSYETCMRRAVSTADMVDCAGRESDRWDARLNRAYQSRMAALNDRQRSALKRAEKTWLAFRQADCEAYEDEEWGTISKIDASQCFLRRTVERTLELEAFPADHGPG